MARERRLSDHIETSELQPGDHIYAWRKLENHVDHIDALTTLKVYNVLKKLKTYAHHGIFMGEDKVIHFNGSISSTATAPKHDQNPCTKCGCDGKGEVIQTCLECFLKGDDKLYRYGYNISRLRLMTTRFGTCTSVSCVPAEDTLHRARQYLENGYIAKYDFLKNNCEHFAVHCKTGLTIPTAADTNTLRGQTYNLRLVGNPFLLPVYPLVRIHEDAKLRKIRPKH